MELHFLGQNRRASHPDKPVAANHSDRTPPPGL